MCFGGFSRSFLDPLVKNKDGTYGSHFFDYYIARRRRNRRCQLTATKLEIIWERRQIKQTTNNDDDRPGEKRGRPVRRHSFSIMEGVV